MDRVIAPQCRRLGEIPGTPYQTLRHLHLVQMAVDRFEACYGNSPDDIRPIRWARAKPARASA